MSALSNVGFSENPHDMGPDDATAPNQPDKAREQTPPQKFLIWPDIQIKRSTANNPVLIVLKIDGKTYSIKSYRGDALWVGGKGSQTIQNHEFEKTQAEWQQEFPDLTPEALSSTLGPWRNPKIAPDIDANLKRHKNPSIEGSFFWADEDNRSCQDHVALKISSDDPVSGTTVVRLFSPYEEELKKELGAPVIKLREVTGQPSKTYGNSKKESSNKPNQSFLIWPTPELKQIAFANNRQPSRLVLKINGKRYAIDDYAGEAVQVGENLNKMVRLRQLQKLRRELRETSLSEKTDTQLSDETAAWANPRVFTGIPETPATDTAPPIGVEEYGLNSYSEYRRSDKFELYESSYDATTGTTILTIGPEIPK
jgi:hypothetical protein